MSIIYEALKKLGRHPSVQSQSGETGQPGLPRKIKIIPVAAYIVLVILGMLVAKKGFDYLFPKPVSTLPIRQTHPTVPAPALPPDPVVVPPPPAAEVKAEAVPEPAPEEKYVLNGVFSSGNENYALINNQIVKQGDQLEEAIVEKITLDAVELKTLEGPIKLTNRH